LQESWQNSTLSDEGLVELQSKLRKLKGVVE
jgi:hypothetical protein